MAHRGKERKMSTEKKHILLEGERNVGKSALISRLLKEKGLPVYGFYTDTIEAEEEGFHDIFIHNAHEPDNVVWEEKNQIGSCNGSIHKTREEKFESLGVEYLSDVRDDGIILMDELGFMEQNSPKFMARVLELMDGDIHIIASIKHRDDIEFMNKLRAKPKAEVFKINRDNCEELYPVLSEIISKW